MRKNFIFYAVILFSLSGFGELSAQIDNLSNMSAEWIRTGNRNAATDAADIVVYNPGAITELPDGFQIDLGNQTLIRKPKQTYDPGSGSVSHTQDGIDWFVPNIYLTYNMDDWALFGGYYIAGGGATVNYPNGSADINIFGITDGSIKATSIYNTFAFGGAYKINDTVSAALGIRYLSVKNETKIGLLNNQFREDSTQEGDGFGAVAGLNINLAKELNFGIQYQTQVNLELKTSEKNDSFGMINDGEKNRRDLPAVLGLGIGYDINEKLYAEIDYNYWFQKNANWEKNDSGKSISKMAGDVQAAGITASYKVIPELLVSAGAVYTYFMWKDINGYYEANLGSYEVLYTNNLQISGGVAYTIIDGVVLNLGLARTIWEDKELTNSNVSWKIKTTNKTYVAAIGLKISF